MIPSGFFFFLFCILLLKARNTGEASLQYVATPTEIFKTNEHVEDL